MTKLIETITKIKTLYSLLPDKKRGELLRLITTHNLETIAKSEEKKKTTPVNFNTGLYAVSDSKRIKIVKELLESDDLKQTIYDNSKHMRFLNTQTFKFILILIKKELGRNSEIVSLYPEFFI